MLGLGVEAGLSATGQSSRRLTGLAVCHGTRTGSIASCDECRDGPWGTAGSGGPARPGAGRAGHREASGDVRRVTSHIGLRLAAPASLSSGAFPGSVPATDETVPTTCLRTNQGSDRRAILRSVRTAEHPFVPAGRAAPRTLPEPRPLFLNALLLGHQRHCPRDSRPTGGLALSQLCAVGRPGPLSGEGRLGRCSRCRSVQNARAGWGLSAWGARSARLRHAR